VTLRELGADDLRAVDPALTAEVMQALDPHRAVSARTLTGGPAPDMVLAEVDRLEAELRGLGFEP